MGVCQNHITLPVNLGKWSEQQDKNPTFFLPELGENVNQKIGFHFHLFNYKPQKTFHRSTKREQKEAMKHPVTQKQLPGITVTDQAKPNNKNKRKNKM